MRETLVKSFHFAVRNAARLVRQLYPIQAPLPATPLFIVGAARSGNTLLRRMLMAASPIHIPPEMGFMFEAIECYRERRYYTWPALVRRTLKWFAHNEQFADLVPRLPAVEAALIALPRGGRSFSAIVDAVYRDDAARLGRAVTHWGDKTPRNARHMDKIASGFDAVKFVHLIRDGADVVHSIMAKDGLRDFRGPARRWIEPVEAARAYSRAHPEQCLEVRYEDLVREPDAALKRVAGFIGVPCDLVASRRLDVVADMGDVGRFAHHASVRKPVFSDSIGAGRRDLTPAQANQLHELIGPLLEELGYARLAQ